MLNAILVPKVDRPRDLHTIDTLLSGIETAVGLKIGKIKLEAQIESAEGLANIDAIAGSTDRLESLHFGPGDYARACGCPRRASGLWTNGTRCILATASTTLCTVFWWPPGQPGLGL